MNSGNNVVRKKMSKINKKGINHSSLPRRTEVWPSEHPKAPLGGVKVWKSSVPHRLTCPQLVRLFDNIVKTFGHGA